MMDNSLSSHFVAQLMEQSLAGQPVRVGMRLKPEEVLADQLGLNRHQLRKATELLVSNGTLRRKRGSGTYIAAVPKLDSLKGASGSETKGAAKAAKAGKVMDSMTEGSVQVMRKAMAKGLVLGMEESLPGFATKKLPSARKLHLGLWADLHCMGSTHQKVIAGMTQRAGALGHSLSVNSTVVRINEPLVSERLSERIRSNPCDGFIVAERWGELFLEALAPVNVSTPTVFMHSARRTHDLWPVVSQDPEWAMEQALRKFFEQGHRRLAILAPSIEAYPIERLRCVYESVTRELGLTYQRFETCELGVVSAMHATTHLLTEDRPDAVYITDDFLVEGVCESLVHHRVEPGVDLGVITLCNADQPLTHQADWSRIEFNSHVLGEMAVDLLIRLIEDGPDHVSSVRLTHQWIPGRTHLHRGSANAKRNDKEDASLHRPLSSQSDVTLQETTKSK